MARSIFLIIALVLAALILTNLLQGDEAYNLKLEQLKVQHAIKPIPSVDHSKLPALQREFGTPQEVTETCISCHTERHVEVMASSHWNWERVSYIEGRGIRATGKKNVLNNFCLGSRTNEKACAKCHIGFGMTNDHFDFNNARNVDCMVCHDNSEEYLKGSALAGYPDRGVNLGKVAQSVGNPTRTNCGSCHFYSGGGNNVKHGDLEEALLSCSREVDVHMATNGMDMSCTSCHTARNHQMLGKLYSVSSTNTQRATCEQCHTGTPHFDQLVNRHTAKVSCQACHIPVYAKENPTKMAWRWSDAGRLQDGQAYVHTDSTGQEDYMSIKGSFTWEKNVIPDYVWFNGTADHFILGDTIHEVPVKMNTLYGSHDDKESRIIPVKIHLGDQIYDKNTKMLIQPKLHGEAKGDSAYWQDLDWNLAAMAGMKTVGLPYSGEYDFVETVMYWPVNHMVSPKDQTLSCNDCHQREDGRLAQLTGFYLPGRDYNRPLETAGHWLFFGALLSVFIHGLARFIVSIRKKEYDTKVIDYQDQNQE